MINQQDPYEAVMQKYNYTPPASSGQPVSSAQDFDNFLSKQGSYAPPPSQPNPIQETVDNYMGENGVGAASADIMGGGNVADAVKKAKSGDTAGAIESATLGVGSDAVKALFAPIAAPIQTLLAHTARANAANPSITANTVNSPEAEAARKSITDWATAHPDLAKTMGDAFNVGAGVLGADGLTAPVSDVIDATKNAVGAAKDAASATADVIKGTKTAISGMPPNDLETIADMISPKPTIGQAKLAMDQGRLFAGKPAGFFKEGGTPQIAASEQIGNSARTISRLLPDAAKMDEPTLYSALDEKVGELSTNLKPEMQAVKVKPETVSNMEAQWEDIKTEQNNNAYTPADVQVKKLQTEFEKRLEAAKDGTMDDVWEARKAYDNSVPKNVKQANDLSSESLQAKKEIWLQNRQIFSDAINDESNGLGKTSQQAFSDMRDMYEAQTGLLSKAKASGVGEPSTIQKIGKSKAGKAIKAGAKIFVGDKILKGTTGIGF